jgi:hypothetical protein
MAKPERYLHFSNLEIGQPVSAQCSACDRLFLREPKPGERTDDVLLDIRAEFEAHKCKESAA